MFFKPMIKTFTLCLSLLLILLGWTQNIYSQSTLIYSEDFENGPGSFLLNTNEDITTNSGSNKWIINNQYTGQPLYPNTTDQSNTTGGLINFAPFSNYLHIHDSVALASQNIGNANFNPQNASDRMVRTNSFCTLGMNNVIYAFYYLYQGNTGTSLQLYYSANNGPWTIAPGGNLNATNTWRYTEVTSPAFYNLTSLRFAYKWTNTSTALAPTISAGIDAIRLVGTIDPEEFPVDISITSISPNPVCRKNNVLMFFNISAPLCGQGFYQAQLSNQFGSFVNAVNLGIYQVNNTVLNNAFFLTIPGNTVPGDCYRIRIVRGDINPVIISDTSDCLQIIDCPNTITTLEPIVLSNEMDTICVGSVIDIPFFSTGVYTNNTYVAQLSDSTGLFPPNPNVIGSSVDSETYDPALGSDPGSVGGLLVPQNQPIPPGCDYYIRIVGISPFTVGTVYGPFCIRNCDIETNNKQDLQFCIDDINGADTTITFEIDVFEQGVVYGDSNQFDLQVLDSQTFAVVNTGVIGSVSATTSGTMQITIPNLPGLGAIGMIPGMYYVRVVSSDPSQPWNNLGTLIRLTIGAPFPGPLTIQTYDVNVGLSTLMDFPGDSLVCFNEGIFFTFRPFNPTSSYSWTLNNQQDWATDRYIGILFNAGGNYTLSVTETNFGCVGPGSNVANISVLGPPNVSIQGPILACEGSTRTYSVPLEESTFYSWSAIGANVLDTLNNQVTIGFPTPGTATISINALNICGEISNTRQVIVRALPEVNAGNDTLICVGQEVILSTPTGTGYNFFWSELGESVFNNSQTIGVTPDSTITYEIRVTSSGTLACERRDTITVEVGYPQLIEPKDTLICQGDEVVLKSELIGDSYFWNTGNSDQAIFAQDSGWYYVYIYNDTLICPTIDSIMLKIEPCYIPFEVPNVFTPNGDGINDTFIAKTTFDYEEFFIEIYNRWGRIVYESNNPFFEWDGGTKNGDFCPAGVYFFIAKHKHFENSDEQKGTITLIR